VRSFSQTSWLSSSNVSLRRSASVMNTSRYGLLVSQTRSTRQCHLVGNCRQTVSTGNIVFYISSLPHDVRNHTVTPADPVTPGHTRRSRPLRSGRIEARAGRSSAHQRSHTALQSPICALRTKGGDDHQDYIAELRGMPSLITALSGDSSEKSAKDLYTLRTNYRVRQFPQTVLKFLHPAERNSQS